MLRSEEKKDQFSSYNYQFLDRSTDKVLLYLFTELFF